MKELLKLSIPITINRAGGQLSIIVVLSLLGLSSTVELALFALALSVAGVIFAFVSIIVVGAQNTSAQAWSINNLKYLDSIFRSGFYLSLMVGLIGYFITQIDLNLFYYVADENGLASGSSRLYKLLGLAVPIVAMISFFTFYLEGIGKANFTSCVKIVEMVAQVGLTALLIFGVTGHDLSNSESAVLSLITADVIALAIYLTYFIVNRRDELVSLVRLKKDDVKRIISLVSFGLPVAGGLCLQKLAYTTVAFVIAGYGATFVAAYSITLNLVFLIQIPVTGIAHANSILVSRSLGARNFSNAKRLYQNTLFCCGTVIGVSVTLIYLLLSVVLQLFTRDQEVTTLISSALIGMIALTLGQATITIVVSYLRSFSDTWYPQVLLLTTFYLVIIPVIILTDIFYVNSINTVMASMGLVFILAYVFLQIRAGTMLVSISKDK